MRSHNRAVLAYCNYLSASRTQRKHVLLSELPSLQHFHTTFWVDWDASPKNMDQGILDSHKMRLLLNSKSVWCQSAGFWSMASWQSERLCKHYKCGRLTLVPYRLVHKGAGDAPAHTLAHLAWPAVCFAQGLTVSRNVEFTTPTLEGFWVNKVKLFEVNWLNFSCWETTAMQQWSTHLKVAGIPIFPLYGLQAKCFFSPL